MTDRVFVPTDYIAPTVSTSFVSVPVLYLTMHASFGNEVAILFRKRMSLGWILMSYRRYKKGQPRSKISFLLYKLYRNLLFCFLFNFSKGGNVNIRLHCKISFHLLLFHEISIYSGMFITKNIAK